MVHVCTLYSSTSLAWKAKVPQKSLFACWQTWILFELYTYFFNLFISDGCLIETDGCIAMCFDTMSTSCARAQLPHSWPVVPRVDRFSWLEAGHHHDSVHAGTEGAIMLNLSTSCCQTEKGSGTCLNICGANGWLYFCYFLFICQRRIWIKC